MPRPRKPRFVQGGPMANAFKPKGPHECVSTDLWEGPCRSKNPGFRGPCHGKDDPNPRRRLHPARH